MNNYTGFTEIKSLPRSEFFPGFSMINVSFMQTVSVKHRRALSSRISEHPPPWIQPPKAWALPPSAASPALSSGSPAPPRAPLAWPRVSLQPGTATQGWGEMEAGQPTGEQAPEAGQGMGRLGCKHICRS